jgi:hypothetical protein
MDLIGNTRSYLCAKGGGYRDGTRSLCVAGHTSNLVDAGARGDTDKHTGQVPIAVARGVRVHQRSTSTVASRGSRGCLVVVNELREASEKLRSC